MITLNRNQLGLWSVPNLIERDRSSDEVILNRTILPKASDQIIFGRGASAKHPASALKQQASTSLAVVGASSCKSKQIQDLIETILLANSNVRIFKVHGRANHEAIRTGIDALHKIQANSVIVIGGGTTLDVGKAIAGLAHQEGGHDIVAFQRGEKSIDPKKAVPWIAVPTTSGTGSESTNNSVVELGDEKRSIRNIPPPSMIIADPALTDSLPLSPTIVSTVDALAQSLEVITHEKASSQVQAIALASFLNLAEGLKALISDAEIALHTRDALSWGSLLMGVAFAHAGLGLLLACTFLHEVRNVPRPDGRNIAYTGTRVQALHDKATAVRLERVEEAFLASKEQDNLNLEFEGDRLSLARQNQATTQVAEMHNRQAVYASRLTGFA